jgi:D-alanine--poly(phosphoribitol) ligase subunit 2
VYDKIKKFLISYIEQKGSLPKNIDLDKFDYIDAGYIDSIGVIKFIVEIEKKFNVEISEEDMLKEEFRTIGGLTKILDKKLGMLS